MGNGKSRPDETASNVSFLTLGVGRAHAKTWPQGPGQIAREKGNPVSTDTVTCTAGQAASRAGISRKALRVYLERGLLAETERTPVGYRLYTDSDVAVLSFIRQARALGLHLDDIADILAIRRGGAAPCAAVTDLIDIRITEIDTAIAGLTALRATLARSRAATPAVCPPGGADQQSSVCSIVENADPA